MITSLFAHSLRRSHSLHSVSISFSRLLKNTRIRSGNTKQAAPLFVALVLSMTMQNALANSCDSLMEKFRQANLSKEQIEIICGTEAPQAHQPSSPTEVSNKTSNSDHSVVLQPMLESHSPSSIGATKDSDDVWFMDANISLRYPLFYESLGGGCDTELIPVHFVPYFAFTGRFAQYLLTRDSSPVVMKSFNPEFFLRFYPTSYGMNDPEVIDTICGKGGEQELTHHNERLLHPAGKTNLSSNKFVNYIDLQYGHLSNGQSVADQNTFNTVATTLGGWTPAQSREFAKDYISRGWDYFGIAWTQMEVLSQEDTLYLHAHKYVGGIFQQNIEEFLPWENRNSDITRLQQVSGLKMQYTYRLRGDKKETGLNNWSVTLETGMQSPLKHNTARFDTTFFVEYLGAQLNLWVQQGYNSDLAQYYKQVKSGGVAFQFTTFDNP